MNNISPKVQNQLGMLQQIQQQLQTILQQKAQYETGSPRGKAGTGRDQRTLLTMQSCT